jgi:hypothetical protein
MEGGEMKFTVLFMFPLLLLSACTNITEKRGGARFSSSGNPALASFAGAMDTHLLKNAVVAAVATTGGAPGGNLEITLAVDTGQVGFQPLTGFCGLGQANPCFCELKWLQTTPDQSDFTRTRKLPVTAVQSGLVRCLIPGAVWDEIGVSTQIQMNIVPGAGNTTGLSCTSLQYKKGTVVGANGDFLDSTLTPFRNIHRYACHTRRRGSYEINSQIAESLSDVGPMDAAGERTSVSVPIANKFCVGPIANNSGGNANGGGNSVEYSCGTVREGFSAQNYYRNFYVRSDTLVQNTSSNNFECPMVLESIRHSAGSVGKNPITGASTVPPSERNKLWPMDTTFALATTFSPDWSVGVSAASRLLRSGDTTSSSSSICQGENQNGILQEQRILIRDCLGYAKKPNADGTCGTIRDNNGRVRPLVRLRRYRAILPGGFLNTGEPVGTNPHADEIYVADRLVIDQNGVATGEMIYGPKPCSYAWFDHEGITKRDGTANFFSKLNRGGLTYATPRYVSTAKYFRDLPPLNGVWDGPHESVNPDGMVFPNFDSKKFIGQLQEISCSAVLPKVVYQNGEINGLQLITTHQTKASSISIGNFRMPLDEVHLQPVDPWTPEYREDTAFQACVPVSDPYLEPPMHFYKTAGGDYAWCTKPYPTQNANWVALNRLRQMDSNSASVLSMLAGNQARVSGFTSHETWDGWSDDLDARNSNPADINDTRCTGTGIHPICEMTTGTATDATCVNYLNSTAISPNRGALTCDRTAIYSLTDYKDFPLQATSRDIEDVLARDLAGQKNFACTYSVSPDRSKVGKAYPSTGCCGKFGNTTVLGGLQSSGVRRGHLEPQINPQVPDVRFCGWPVR